MRPVSILRLHKLKKAKRANSEKNEREVSNPMKEKFLIQYFLISYTFLTAIGLFSS